MRPVMTAQNTHVKFALNNDEFDFYNLVCEQDGFPQILEANTSNLKIIMPKYFVYDIDDIRQWDDFIKLFAAINYYKLSECGIVKNIRNVYELDGNQFVSTRNDLHYYDATNIDYKQTYIPRIGTINLPNLGLIFIDFDKCYWEHFNGAEWVPRGYYYDMTKTECLEKTLARFSNKAYNYTTAIENLIQIVNKLLFMDIIQTLPRGPP